MKPHLYITISLILFSQIVNAQITTPSPYSGGVKINYIRSWETQRPYIADADVISEARTSYEVKQSTEYFDALGRLVQNVLRRGSLNTSDTARDMVIPVVYDEFGRETYTYLPFAANSTGDNTSISDGKFKLNPFQQDSAFNKSMFIDENYIYKKTVFEPSPLNRVLEQFPVGDNWGGTVNQSSEQNRRSSKTKFWVNTAADSVRNWEWGIYGVPGYYAAGTLHKIVTQDEHNKQTIEFKDK